MKPETRVRATAVVLVTALAACGGAAETKSAASADSAPQPPKPPRLPDSLALRAPDGTELWFTDARTAKSPATGATCIERVMEIRRDSLRIPVPLLYTAERPVLVNDTLASAHIYLDCAPGNLYRINLRNGQPIYVGKEK